MMFSGSDNQRVTIRDIEKLLNKAPSLKDKPKLIISQACRGREYISLYIIITLLCPANQLADSSV